MGGKTRKQLRKDMRRILNALDERWVKAASGELCTNLVDLFENEISEQIEHVLAWVPFFPGEPDLTRFINETLEKRIVYLPRIYKDRQMTFTSIGRDWLEKLAPGVFGIPEPLQDYGVEYDPEALPQHTAVIVPGLAFDKHGDRVGRGRGYYDTFFSRGNMREALTIGACWELQVVDEVSSQSHDCDIHWICHERGVINTDERVDEVTEEE